MSDRDYRIVLAETEGGLDAVAGDYTILKPAKRFETLRLAYDDTYFDLGDEADIRIDKPGWIALAYKER